MLIPLAQIDPPTRPLRGAVSELADANLAASVKELGVVTPILVIRNGNRYALVAGERRVKAARAAGLTEIPAEIAARFDEGYVYAAGAAENMVRAGMEPLDQWRAIVELQRLGYTLPGAAACLGMSERHARKLDRLGRLHPDILELIQAVGLPREQELTTIARAPLDVQAAARKVRGAVRGGKKIQDVDWWAISRACQVQRIAKSTAIFDTTAAGVVFEEDFFETEGDDDDRLFTLDVAGFMSAQRAALETQVDQARAKKKRHMLADYGANGWTLPAGYKDAPWGANAEKLKPTEVLFRAVDARNGEIVAKVEG